MLVSHPFLSLIYSLTLNLDGLIVALHMTMFIFADSFIFSPHLKSFIILQIYSQKCNKDFISRMLIMFFVNNSKHLKTIKCLFISMKLV